MINVSLMSKREDFSREQFREYYENNHSKLGMKYFQFIKYLRNYVIDSSGLVDFDVAMQCVMAPDFDIVAVNFDPNVRPIFDKDERAFMIPERTRAGAINERVVSGPPVDFAPEGSRRQWLLIRKAEGVSNQVFERALDAYATDFGQNTEAVTVTVGVSHGHSIGYSSLPFDAIISLWLAADSDAVVPMPPPHAFIIDGWVLTEVCEDPQDILTAAFGTR